MTLSLFPCGVLVRARLTRAAAGTVPESAQAWGAGTVPFTPCASRGEESQPPCFAVEVQGLGDVSRVISWPLHGSAWNPPSGSGSTLLTLRMARFPLEQSVMVWDWEKGAQGSPQPGHLTEEGPNAHHTTAACPPRSLWDGGAAKAASTGSGGHFASKLPDTVLRGCELPSGVSMNQGEPVGQL